MDLKADLPFIAGYVLGFALIPVLFCYWLKARNAFWKARKEEDKRLQRLVDAQFDEAPKIPKPPKKGINPWNTTS